ncbi:hypothetical protein AB0J77_14500 [Micromonospora tulbaghiae]|uniref:hypothetical protein n=1 Tax=Micromonospora tulbaghiae TaxID=479978 RepID=UPI00344980CD
MSAPAAVVEVIVLTHLQESLRTATDADIAAIALHWAALHGHVADTARHLIDEEREYRAALAHDLEAAHTALVASMCPSTYWTATNGSTR